MDSAFCLLMTAERTCGLTLTEGECVADGEEQVGLVTEPNDIGCPWPVGGDPKLRAGVSLCGIFLARAVKDRHFPTVSGDQLGGQGRGFGIWCDNLTGVRMIGGDHDERLTVLLGEVQSLLHRLI